MVPRASVAAGRLGRALCRGRLGRARPLAEDDSTPREQRRTRPSARCVPGEDGEHHPRGRGLRVDDDDDDDDDDAAAAAARGEDDDDGARPAASSRARARPSGGASPPTTRPDGAARARAALGERSVRRRCRRRRRVAATGGVARGSRRPHAARARARRRARGRGSARGRRRERRAAAWRRARRSPPSPGARHVPALRLQERLVRALSTQHTGMMARARARRHAQPGPCDGPVNTPRGGPVRGEASIARARAAPAVQASGRRAHPPGTRARKDRGAPCPSRTSRRGDPRLRARGGGRAGALCASARSGRTPRPVPKHDAEVVLRLGQARVAATR